MTDNDYGHAERAAALALSEAELRRRVDVLLEQCGREVTHPALGHGRPAGPYLHVSEVLLLLGVGVPVPYDLLAEHLGFQADTGIRPHLPSTPADDAKREAFEVLASSGYCADGTCGECGACDLRRGERPVNDCPFCMVSTNPDLVDHVRNCHPLSFDNWYRERGGR